MGIFIRRYNLMFGLGTYGGVALYGNWDAGVASFWTICHDQPANSCTKEAGWIWVLFSIDP